MESSMDAFKKLGAKSDGNLRDYAIEWSRPNRAYTSLLSDYRGVVILDGASAESRLEAGTLIPGSTTEYTLAGKGLDLGGQALHTFKAAQSGIAHAKAQTQADMGKTIDGKVVTQSELDDLDKVNDRMNSIIQNQIYGKHDIQSCVDQIGHDLGRNDTRGAERLRMDIDNSLALNRNSADKQLVAKLFRDRATLDLGVAQFELNGPNASQADILVNGDANHSGRQSIYNDGQQRGYDGAIDEIALAKQYDPTNPDLPQLEAIAARLEQGIPGGVQKQQSNPIFNPNNVNDQVNHPGLQSKI
jgi:hypothetical protein